MSTPDHAPFKAIEHHLLEIDPTLRTRLPRPVALPAPLLALETLNATLQQANTDWLAKARALYQQPDLNSALQHLDDITGIDGQGRKTFMAFTAGSTAVEHEARLNVADGLLAPSDQQMVEDTRLGPGLRPGLYALTFTYQEQQVEFAGAFVLTRKASPIISELTGGEDVGAVLLFTPSRGLEAFASLAELDQALLAAMTQPAGHREFIRHLPVRYQALDVAGIWPLELQPIDAEPLFEHTWNAVLDKRRQDVEDAVRGDVQQRTQRLDQALADSLPDLTPRLDLRAQRLLELNLYHSLPDWYRSASAAHQHTLNQHVQHYNAARQAFLDLLGPAATPATLAHAHLVERLAETLDIHDLDPAQLTVTTQRSAPNVGTYAQRQSLVELSLRGLHTDDEKPGSTFLQHTRLTYAAAPLGPAHAALTPASVLTLLHDLQPRLDFARVQKAWPDTRQAARAMLDQRLVMLAFIARLQGHLSEADHQLFEHLREHPQPHLCAQSVSLHGAQLRDLWLLREEDAGGQVKRLLLCTPQSPRGRSFTAFTSVRECQTHLIGWADDPQRYAGRTMSDYLLEQLPLRFRPSMATLLQSLGFKPDAGEHLDVTFGKPCNHTECLDAMASHLLDGQQVDDYEHGTPLWYRSASSADRTRLTTLSNHAAGALHSYNDRPDAEARFPTFDAYLHDQARLSLNALLGRRSADIDPDSVFAYAAKPLLGKGPAPLSYTKLYRDGYEDGIGFLDEKFSASATFRGPPGVDLSALTPQKVARSVTGVWIGQRYTDEVRRRLLAADSPGYTSRRDATLAIIGLQMKSAALEARLQGHIASADLAWLDRAIDSLPDTSGAARTTYAVHRLSIDGDWVIGCYLFRHGDDPVLLYTPNAPDGIGFREARLFNYLVKQDNGLQAYFSDRVGVQAQVRVKQFLIDVQKGLPQHLDRSAPSPARYAPLTRPLTDLRHEFYNMALQRKIDDVHATTTHRLQMISAIVWSCVEWVTAIATIPFPILSLSLGGLLAFKDAMLALSAYQQGDKNAALQHFIGYLANLGGALLFDLRPALVGPFNTLSPVRPLLKSAKNTADTAPLLQLHATPPHAWQPVIFEGRTLWTTPAPDALGRHLLYRQDLASGQMLSTGRLVNQNAQGHWVRSGLAGGGRDSYQVLTEEVDDALAAYEIPATHSKNFRAVLDPTFKQKLTQDWEVGVVDVFQDNAIRQLRPLHDAYTAQVEKLTQDAAAFFNAPPPLPVRPPLPHIDVHARPGEVFTALRGQGKPLIVGAQNASIASKQLLIENMQTLADLGYKRLYLENLPVDLFAKTLKIINREAEGNLTVALQRIEKHFANVDHALGYAPDAPFTFRQLVLQAHRHNVAIDGLDVTASYHMEHLLELSDGERFIPRNSRLRNFYSHKMIERNAAKHTDAGWMALVEKDRVGTYERIPGLADLQNAQALRVEDVTPEQPQGIWPDTLAASQSRGHYTLAMATRSQARPQPGTAPVAAAAHFDEFDMPAALRSHARQLTYSHRGLDTRYSLRYGDPRNNAFIEFVRIRQRLQERAAAFFNTYTATPRPPLHALTTLSDEVVFIEWLYRQKTGLVVGEAHSAQSSKQFLINHMKLLKKQGVKTLYIEHLLTDLHQRELDLFHDTLNMPGELKDYLKRQDRGQMFDYQGPNTYTNVVKAANKYGIRVRALDCTASYHVKGLRADTPRNTLFSYFANQVIKADQAAYGPHKWVAFVGSSHTDLNMRVPGLVQLQDAASLHVRDAAASSGRKLRVGGWEVDEFNHPALRSDFVLEVGVSGRRAIPPPTSPSRARLTTKGFFLIERPSSAETNLVHRSNSGEIVVTPIQVDDQGQFFIDRWEKIRDKRFMFQSQLLEALRVQIHLTPVL
ncbi:dermonecrotic toxin domain-containing protein [Pseudomonas sp. SDO528_S397]